jgi:hypothetical protein
MKKTVDAVGKGERGSADGWLAVKAQWMCVGF